MNLTIYIPNHQELLVSVGQDVDLKSPFLKKSSPTNVVLKISESLGFRPERIFKFLKKFVGETVKKGELLAEYKTFLSSKQFVSNFEGLIKEVNHQTGTLLIETATDQKNIIPCFFQGTVIGIDGNLLQLQVNELVKYQTQPQKTYTGGQVTYHKDKNKLTEETISNKFICVDAIKLFDQVKQETLGANGFITLSDLKKETKLPKIKIKKIEDFKQILDGHLPYCITGEDDTTIYFYA